MKVHEQEDFEHKFIQLAGLAANIETPAVSTNDDHTNIDVYTNALGAALWLGTLVTVYARVQGGRVAVGSFFVATDTQRVTVQNVAAAGFDVTVTPTGDTPSTPLVLSAIAYGIQPGRQSGTQVLTLVNGVNADVPVQPNGVYLINGPTAPFSIVGLASSASPLDGQRVIILNPNFDSAPTTGQPMTIMNNDLADEPTPSNAIRCGNGAAAVFPAPPAEGFTTCEFVYSALVNRWLLIGV